MLQTAVPLVCYFALKNKTIELNITDDSSYLYKFVLDSIHINQVSLGTPVFEQLNGTDKLHVRLSNVNVDADINGEVDGLHLIPFKA